MDSRFSTVICAPIYTSRYRLSTEVPVGPDKACDTIAASTATPSSAYRKAHSPVASGR